jgi:peptidoglycan/LPS O-acetylase OafA/YrhL
LYWLTFKVKLGRLNALNNEWDISYGTYLYGWPASLALLFWVNHQMNPILLALLSLPLSYALGAASWYLVERHAIAFAHRTGRVASSH